MLTAAENVGLSYSALWLLMIPLLSQAHTHLEEKQREWQAAMEKVRERESQ